MQPKRKRLVDVEELLVWTYRDQRADKAASKHGTSAYPSAGGRDSTVRVGAIAELGVRIDEGSPDPGMVHRDAERVHEVVSRFPKETGALLLQHGRQAARPEWGEGMGRLRCEPVWRSEPQYDESGLPRPRTFRVEIHVTSRRPVLCPVQYTRDDDAGGGLVDFYRRQYRAWHEGLIALRMYFERNPLDTLNVYGPTAPASPWEESKRKRASAWERGIIPR